MAAAQTDLPEGVQDHSSLQRRFWAAQRVAWIIFALVIIGCLAGGFGRGGYLSRMAISTEFGAVDYPFLTRWNAPDTFEITFAPAAEDRVFFVDGRFFDAFSVETIDPPQKATLVRDGMTGYVFPSDPTKPTRITFRVQTQVPGLRSIAFGVDGAVAEHKIFVFP